MCDVLLLFSVISVADSILCHQCSYSATELANGAGNHGDEGCGEIFDPALQTIDCGTDSAYCLVSTTGRLLNS